MTRNTGVCCSFELLNPNTPELRFSGSSATSSCVSRIGTPSKLYAVRNLQMIVYTNLSIPIILPPGPPLLDPDLMHMLQHVDLP